MKFVEQFLYVIPAKKFQLLLIILLFITVSALDAVGIGLIGPFLSLAVKPEVVNRNVWLSQFYRLFPFENTNQFIAALGLMIIVIFYFKSFFYFQIQSYVLRFSYTQQVKLRLRMLRTYLALPYSFYLKTNSAQIINNIGSESANFTYSIVIPLLNSIANAFVLVVLLTLLAKTDLLATVSILGVLLMAIAPFHYFRHKIEAWGKEGTDANMETIRVINHAIGGFKETKLLGCEVFFEDQLNAQTLKYARAASKFHISQQLPRIVVEVLLMTFVVGFVSLSLVVASRSESLISVLGIFAIASVRIIPSASQLITCLGVLRNAKPSLDKIYLDLKELEKPENIQYLNMTKAAVSGEATSSATGLSRLEEKKLSFSDCITLTQVNYSYPGSDSNALKDISLTIPRGESIALIGKSGAGKTTLVDVFLGLLVPQSGDIQIDGWSVYQNLRTWQNSIGYIPQSIFLMDDTVKRNIAFGVPDYLIDEKRLWYAIELAQLSELIRELPEGLETSIGERGVRLSGGQRQRLGIARALYHEREILVLDEATSALDNETEAMVSESIRALSGAKTMIIIAHRLTTVEHCDRIYEMKQGQIMKCGSYKEVVLEKQNRDQYPSQ